MEAFDIQNGVLRHYYGKSKIIEIPSSVKVIGHGAFCACKIQEIVIPETVTEIEDSAFLDCKKLKKINIPGSVKVIGKRAFFGCKIQEIYLSEGVTEIKESAFSHFKKIKSIVIPNSVKVIGESAFQNCKSLKSVTIQGIGKIDFVAITRTLISPILPKGAEKKIKIAEDAFFGCVSLR